MSDIVDFGEQRKERDLAQEQKDHEECNQLHHDLTTVCDGKDRMNIVTVLFCVVGEIATEMGMTPSHATKYLEGAMAMAETKRDFWERCQGRNPNLSAILR